MNILHNKNSTKNSFFTPNETHKLLNMFIDDHIDDRFFLCFRVQHHV